MSSSVIVPNTKSTTQKVVAAYNAITTDSMAVYLPNSAFKDMVQLGTDDLDFWFEPYLVLPRLLQLEDWIIYPSKNNNTWCYKHDGVVRLLTQLMYSMVVGDGMKVKIYEDEDLKQVDKERTRIVEDWLNSPTGSSGDNRGRTVNNWVIPLIVVDNIISGGSAWSRFVGMQGISPPEEMGKLMIKWLEPRTYVKVYHEYYGYTKLIQFPITQWGLPTNKADFDRWNPTIRNRFENASGYCASIERSAVHIPSDQYYWFNLFLEAPMNTAIQDILSKIILRFLRDKFIEKATYPAMIVKVPRNAQLDPDDEEFKLKLKDISEMFGKLRSNDILAIEGEMYDYSASNEKITLSDGWEIVPLEVQRGMIDFEAGFRHLNEEIAHSLMSSMSLVSSIGVQGRTTTLSTGGYINQNFGLIVKNIRQNLKAVFKFVIRDALKMETGEDEIELRLIDVAFSKIREEDAAQFLNQILSYQGAGAMTTNEMRELGGRIGMDLEPFPPEMTPEGQTMLGLDDLLNEGDFVIPESFLKIGGQANKLDEEMEMEKERAQQEKESNQVKKEK